MPENKHLPDRKHPLDFKWQEKARPEFKEALNAIRVEMLSCPNRQDVMKYIAEFCLATWEDVPKIGEYSDRKREDTMRLLFQGKVLPNMFETINFTFLISNIDLIDVTHLIRHRTFTFSAHCTGDRDQRHDTALVKPGILYSNYLDRYERLVSQAFNLYADMLDDGEISLMDARTVLPRCMANHYYMQCNLKDLIHYLNIRLDKQIQPESDNIIAMKILNLVATQYPEIQYKVEPDAIDKFYVATAPTELASNLYRPEAKNDVFEWKPQWFIYPRTREEMSGGQIFKGLYDQLLAEYRRLTDD